MRIFLVHSDSLFTPFNLSAKPIQLCEKQIFHLGEKTVDLNQGPFIHQLFYEGKGRAPAISLHVYGCSLVERLFRIFFETRKEHLYSESDIEPISPHFSQILGKLAHSVGRSWAHNWVRPCNSTLSSPNCEPISTNGAAIFSENL